MANEYLAPEGTIWVCSACGRSGVDRTRIGDEACFLNAVLCYFPQLAEVWEPIHGISRWPTKEELATITKSTKTLKDTPHD